MAENFVRFVEMTVKKELLNIEKTAKIWLNEWQLSFQESLLNKPSLWQSEFAGEERNEDGNLTSIDVIKVKSVNYFESITKQLLDSAFVWSEEICRSYESWI